MRGSVFVGNDPIVRCMPEPENGLESSGSLAQQRDEHALDDEFLGWDQIREI